MWILENTEIVINSLGQYAKGWNAHNFLWKCNPNQRG